MNITPVNFEDYDIRRVYDEETETWYFSVVDIIRALLQQPDFQTARNYWKVLRNRLNKEGSETVTNCNRLKLPAEDGKMRLTDVASPEVLLRLIQSVPSPKAEPIKLWLARVGYERMQEMADPARSLDRARSYWQQQGRSEKWIQQRMDGDNVAADFGNRFAAEIRLPEALEEKLLCPFHYFGIADPIAINGDQFWRNGKYDAAALENVYVLDPARARQRVGAIISALHRYEPDVASLKGIGFCVTIRHAEYMAEQFSQHGIPSAAFTANSDSDQCADLLARLKNGHLIFLFTVDKLSEGVDVPEINTVLFLRPTESLTVFLQQLGRGLRHVPEKDCLTVLDFVGQTHRRYRIDTKLKALLPRHRFSIDKAA